MCDSPNKRSSSDASYLRKIKKPLIEKKRRERINTCLNQLKNILLDNIKQNGTQVSKLDKADILEMTVSHLRQIQHQQMSVAIASDVKAASEYNAGYRECAREAMRFLHTTQGQGHSSYSGLQNHLVNSLNTVRQVTEQPHGMMNTPLSLQMRPPSVDMTSLVRHSQSPTHSLNSNMANGLLIPVTNFVESHHRNALYQRSAVTPDFNGNSRQHSGLQNSVLELSPRESENGNQSLDAFREASTSPAGYQSDEESRDQARQDILNADEESVWRPW